MAAAKSNALQQDKYNQVQTDKYNRMQTNKYKRILTFQMPFSDIAKITSTPLTVKSTEAFMC